MEIQEGIYFDSGIRPKGHFLIAFISVENQSDSLETGRSLAALWSRLRDLKRGILEDFPGHVMPHGGLDFLIGFGPKAFELNDSSFTLPNELSPSHRFLSPRSVGGGPVLIGSGLQYAPDVIKNTATEEFALQFTADTALAVRRAYIETWKELQRQNGPLRLGAFFDGFQRDDGRSWLGFHDGLSNLTSGAERHEAIRVKSGPFTEGTTLAFLRLEVDLTLWETLSPRAQEILVGRQKLSGCPLISVSSNGEPQTNEMCPVAGTMEVGQNGDKNFREPPLGVPPILRSSHVQRANLAHSRSFNDPGSLRIFRQGYEFLEPGPNAPGFRAGLNFISFQDSPRRLLEIITRAGWLGNTNFGGGAGTAQDQGPLLLHCRAGGVYLVPPNEDPDQLPGRAIFGL